MKKIIFLLQLLAVCLPGITTSLYAQSITPYVVNASGGSFSTGYFTIDWNVGEMPLVASFETNPSIVVTNGFLQPYTETPGEINNNNVFGPEEIRVFPNPASTYVEINFLTRQKGTIRFKLYNGQGQLLVQKQFTGNGTGHIERINMERLSDTQYFLQIVLEPAPGSVHKKGGYKIIKTR